MKTAAALIALVLAGAIFWGSEAGRAPASAAPEAAASLQEVRQLTAEVESLRREVGSLEARLAEASAHRSDKAPIDPPRVPESHEALTAEDVAAVRAADAERHREYVAGVARSFAAEKVDPHWAGNTSALVENVFAGDPTLRTWDHQVQCRERTCRLEIANADAEQLRERMPFLTLGLAQSLPNAVADQVQQSDGRTTLVLYMTSQPSSTVASK